MNHAQLKAFHAVAETGGFSAAAEILGLTQPAVTLQVQALEQRYNTKLFRRHGRRTEMTSSGRMLLQISKKIFNLEEEAHALLSSLNAQETGHLEIAVTSSLSAFPLISVFQSRYPKIRLSLKTVPAHQSEIEILEYRTDIVIQNTVPENDRLFYQKLREKPLQLAVSRNHPWSRRRTVTLKELNDQILIVAQDQRHIGSKAHHGSVHANFEAKQTITLTSREIVREAVANSLGVGLFTEPDIRWDERIIGIRITDQRLSEATYLVCQEEERQSSLIAAFVETVTESSGP
jgi:DNA-binding transcriptional LysR family regulator